MKTARRYFCLAALLPIFFASCATFPYGGSFPRVVNVCVLNDKADPASEKIIRKVTTNVFREYEERIGVRFVAKAFVPFEGNLDVWPIELGPTAKNACPENTEVRMIFSNQLMSVLDENGKEVELGGLSHDYYGVLIVFNFDGRAYRNDAGGNPALESSLKHEIGHLFGLNHTEDKNSFMYKVSNKSQGQWTDEILKQLLEKRTKKWY